MVCCTAAKSGHLVDRDLTGTPGAIGLSLLAMMVGLTVMYLVVSIAFG